MRGYILSRLGLEKIEKARSSYDKLSQEQIALNAGLDRGTVSKALQQESAINLRTIRRLFMALNISLNQEDYCKVHSTRELNLTMGDRDDLIAAAEALEAEADEAERQGNSGKAARLREQAARLRRIAAR